MTDRGEALNEHGLGTRLHVYLHHHAVSLAHVGVSMTSQFSIGTGPTIPSVLYVKVY